MVRADTGVSLGHAEAIGSSEEWVGTEQRACGRRDDAADKLRFLRYSRGHRETMVFLRSPAIGDVLLVQCAT